VEDLVIGAAFHHIAPGPGTQGPFAVELFVVQRQDKHGQRRVVSLKLAREFEATPALEREIDQGKVGLEAGHGVERTGYIFSLATHRKVGLALEELTESSPYDGMVVDEEDGLEGRILRHGHIKVGEY
jgi:hypothetical protein